MSSLRKAPANSGKERLRASSASAGGGRLCAKPVPEPRAADLVFGQARDRARRLDLRALQLQARRRERLRAPAGSGDCSSVLCTQRAWPCAGLLAAPGAQAKPLGDEALNSQRRARAPPTPRRSGGPARDGRHVSSRHLPLPPPHRIHPRRPLPIPHPLPRLRGAGGTQDRLDLLKLLAVVGDAAAATELDDRLHGGPCGRSARGGTAPPERKPHSRSSASSSLNVCLVALSLTSSMAWK